MIEKTYYGKLDKIEHTSNKERLNTISHLAIMANIYQETPINEKKNLPASLV